mmetsp:Transcript_35134/g.64249  ORF Transcript_35134/g.64249 Transcript_35134/m.64249 type:complete len:163 (-) Transcript_35134:33-521(-)
MGALPGPRAQAEAAEAADADAAEHSDTAGAVTAALCSATGWSPILPRRFSESSTASIHAAIGRRIQDELRHPAYDTGSAVWDARCCTELCSNVQWRPACNSFGKALRGSQLLAMIAHCRRSIRQLRCRQCAAISLGLRDLLMFTGAALTQHRSNVMLDFDLR